MRVPRFFLLALALTVVGPVFAGPITVAIHDKPPYAFRKPDGTWTGLGVALWEEVAKENGWEFRYQEMAFEELLGALIDGKAEVVVGEMLVNSADEKQIDFSQPFLETHIGVAVSSRRWNPNWFHILVYAFDWGVLKVFLGLIPALVLISFLIYHAERRRNRTHFGGSPFHGFGSAFWFSTVTMTTTGYGDKVPVTFLGRALAVVWMFVSLLLVTAYTASVASTVATVKAGAFIRSADDLRRYTNGVLRGGESSEILDFYHAPIVEFEEYEEALGALEEGSVQTVVGDAVSLQFLIAHQFPGKITLLPLELATSRVAFVLPQESPLREPLNVSLLKQIQSPAWKGSLQDLLGRIPESHSLGLTNGHLHGDGGG